MPHSLELSDTKERGEEKEEKIVLHHGWPLGLLPVLLCLCYCTSATFDMHFKRVLFQQVNTH